MKSIRNSRGKWSQLLINSIDTSSDQEINSYSPNRNTILNFLLDENCPWQFIYRAERRLKR